MPAITINVLGPVEVEVDGRPVPLPAGRLPAMLAALAMSAGRSVSVHRLTEIVWDERPPVSPRRTLQTYATRLRTALRGPYVQTRPEGFRLDVSPYAVDALRFGALLDQSTTERAVLAEALALWRGEPFDGLECEWLRRTASPLLVERYLTAVERRIDIDIAKGVGTPLIAELTALTARYPLRESLWVRLILLLHQNGRSAEALRCYEAVRRQIATELGTDPTPALRQAYADVLAEKSPPGPAATGLVPRQLPAAPRRFAGRAKDLAGLTGLVQRSDSSVIAVTGGAGVGKTWLALRWSHDHLDDFPDGQLFVQLHGFSAADPPLPAAAAMRALLEGLGVTAIPAEPQAQTGLFRSLVAGKRILVVLDNARDSGQVAPLLPGVDGCTVIVTSRNRLTGLVSGHNALQLPLDVVDMADAVAVLERAVGRERLAAEPAAAAALVRRCARLPFALGIVAARLHSQPDFSLASLAADLEKASDRLDVLASADLTANVRTVLSSSYEALDPPAAALLGQLALAPGPDVGVPAAASLLDLPTGPTRACLRQLVDIHLLQEAKPGRFGMHDLVRLYAAEHAGDHDAGLHRIAGYYLRSAAAASDAISSHDSVDGYAQAMTWLETERHNLLALAHRDRRALGELSRTLWHFLDLRGYNDDAHALHKAALTADGREAHAAHALGVVHWRWSRYARAAADFRHAIDIAQQQGDLDVEGYALHHLSAATARLGGYDEAVATARKSVAVAGEIGDHDLHGRCLVGLGIAYWFAGDDENALHCSRQGLMLARRTGNPYVAAHALTNLGLIHSRIGQLGHAQSRFEQALMVARRSGNRYVESNALNGLGRTHRLLGDDRRAGTHFQHAYGVARDTGNRSHQAEILNNLGELARRHGAPVVALKHHRRALAIAQATEEPLERAVAERHLAHAYSDLGTDRPPAALV
ncbi:AfsR/SARP family transcriptional regulator [Fodinicola acaciae]|uniref:AfsR/SARP family transcriptional regulator n=1 Tax=Fodinicola acaciae TaxID=2681555 RepID=UPI0013D23BAB|nr:tetratricopeptide repeat protein [Fodinicola acaciae]